jgi:murein DD-endopeptidase MepM/ murein hydrolase activator NlpD
MPQSAVVAGRVKPHRKTAYVLVLGLTALVFPSPAAAKSSTGGSVGGPTPLVKTIACRTSCAGLGAARPGSLLRLRGRALALVEEVVFQGAEGAVDDVSVAPRRARRAYVDVRVPRTAASGSVVVISREGAESSPTVAPLTVEAAPTPAPAGSGAAPSIDVEVQGDKVFYGAERQAQVSYLVRDSNPVTVVVELVRASDGLAIARWAPVVIPPNTSQTVVWDGTAGGQVQRDGRYQFRISAQTASGARASTSQAAPGGPPSPGSFLFLRHKFPIRGLHQFGEGAAAFGGGRGHQGQDIFAACGTPLVAARGGVVKFKQYHSAAGHYIVIDGEDTGTDYAYMHMREAALVDTGDRVYTGQPIGFVGDTGRADGCHLHLEMWKSPGWYSGGQEFDPLPQLQAWDKDS